MIYAEAAYFDGNHCQHVADWVDFRRLQGLRRRALLAYRASADRRAWRR